MKLFKVKIDNDPGGWKSGEDPSTLVLANTSEEAIQKVKDGWGMNWNIDNGSITYIYGPNCHEFKHITNRSEFSAAEIIFQLPGYTVEIKNIRKEKLNRINKI